MRILMVAQSFSPVVGGEERIVEDLSSELSRRGHEVVVATLEQPLGEPPPRDDGVEVELLGSAVRRVPGLAADPERTYATPVPDPLAARDLRRVIRRHRPDVVHAHNWLVHSYLPLERRSGAAFVLSLHDYSLVCATKRFFYRGAVCSGPAARKCLAHSVEYYGAAKGVVAAAGVRVDAPWLRRRVDMFLPVSEAVRELSGLDDAVPWRVVPNFVPELPAPPAAGDPALARLPEEPFVLYFGDVTEDKGVGALVEAYRQLPEGRPPLVLIGRRLIEGVEEVPGVVALDRVAHPVAIEALRRAAFTVAPSLLPESFGIVALEAAAAGKPTIASALGGLADVVVDGETGFLVPAGDVGGLRGALERLAGDSALRQRMGEAARARAAEFGPDRIVPRFEAAYDLAIASRLKRGAPRRR
ncbi:MAG TPA: glycosyltransferase family 4 protein [Solirubrobacterales bacterium]|nr:glycosyltransferase family 4 protein [Solirubrobacterales bacterium]